jgi:hypothetical protein
MALATQAKTRRYRKPVSKTPFYRTAGYFFIGLVLSCAGIFVFTSAVGQNSFSSGLIALLLIGYGVFTLKNLIIKKE